MEAFKLIADLGFSIAAVIGGGFFIILLLKYILDSVVSRAQGLNGMISSLDNRVKTINNEIERQALQHQIDIIVAQNYLEYVNR